MAGFYENCPWHKKWPTTALSFLELFFSTQALLKTGGHVLTPEIGKARLGPGRPVRPGPRGSLTRCPMAGLVQRGQAV
jgi:hypothetical protein